MTTEILLALAASVCTASASVLMRAAAAPAPGEMRLHFGIVTYLLHRPQWFLGVLCMIAGFGFQLAALHFGELALVQPVIASEILFVFGYLAWRQRGRVHGRDWAAAGGMAACLGGFLYLADPSGGSVREATVSSWLWAGAAVGIVAVVAAALSMARGRGGRAPSPGRRAATLATSAAVTWGFVAAVVKELSSHVGQGAGAVFSDWSPYVLLVVGALGTYLASNAFQAGSLAASQPALTMVEPLVASLLGITLFGEHVRTGIPELAGEALLLLVLAGSVTLLSRSPIVALDELARPRQRHGGGDRGTQDRWESAVTVVTGEERGAGRSERAAVVRSEDGARGTHRLER